MLIYHMTPAQSWHTHPPATPYSADSLATEGFIHCTREPERLLVVANRFYRQQPGDFVILCVETEQLQAEVRWELADGHLFPHIYGPITPAAIMKVIPFPRNPNGEFLTFYG
ncbi:MAG: DUF952 domain-containing protein [Caldilineaceae bacterium]|nr:DUF952 domain-containing protein [Caldilineaceae bacterium]